MRSLLSNTILVVLILHTCSAIIGKTLPSNATVLSSEPSNPFNKYEIETKGIDSVFQSSTTALTFLKSQLDLIETTDFLSGVNELLDDVLEIQKKATKVAESAKENTELDEFQQESIWQWQHNLSMHCLLLKTEIKALIKAHEIKNITSANIVSTASNVKTPMVESNKISSSGQIEDKINLDELKAKLAEEIEEINILGQNLSRTAAKLSNPLSETNVEDLEAYLTSLSNIHENLRHLKRERKTVTSMNESTKKEILEMEADLKNGIIQDKKIVKSLLKEKENEKEEKSIKTKLPEAKNVAISSEANNPKENITSNSEEQNKTLISTAEFSNNKKSELDENEEVNNTNEITKNNKTDESTQKLLVESKEENNNADQDAQNKNEENNEDNKENENISDKNSNEEKNNQNNESIPTNTQNNLSLNNIQNMEKKSNLTKDQFKNDENNENQGEN